MNFPKIVQFFYLNKKVDVVDDQSIPVSFERSSQDLEKAIQSIGILHPLLVRKQKESWQIVSGQARWRYAIQEQIPALEIECSDIQALLVYLYENQARGFNPIESARMVSRLYHDFHFSPKEISDSFSSLLGLPTGNKIITDSISILGMPDIVLRRIAQNKISVKNALVLASFSPEETIQLVQLSDLLNWTGTKQKEAFQWIWEICKKEHCTVSAFLQQKEFREILSREKPHPESFRQVLYKRKHPQLSAAQDAFEKSLKEQNIPGTITITPSNNFEKNDLHVEWSFSSPESFSKSLESLQSLQESKAIEKLFLAQKKHLS
ncbi:MAG: ParB N-terminal domain-containing protein [Candidatus Brocadiae bacterium]|nr:ParB N-terminal domain-containing protein [Candidatus Brocadiia bacterium]